MIGSGNRFAMTVCPDDALTASQREVQRLLGLCLLRLQAYERLIKTLVAEHEFSGLALDLEAVRRAQVEGVSRNTLGQMAGIFLRSYLVAGDDNTAPDPELASAESLPHVGFKFRVELTEADYAQAESEIRELVQLRNTLVHHFIEQQDFDSLDGCRHAEEALIAASDLIGQSYERLREWAEDMGKALEAMQSDQFRTTMIKEIVVAPRGRNRRH